MNKKNHDHDLKEDIIYYNGLDQETITVFCKYCTKFKMHFTYQRDEDDLNIRFHRCSNRGRHDVNVKHF